MTETMDELADRMIPVAQELACRLRSRSGAAAGQRLDTLSRQELYGLAVVALAMVPVDVPTEELLEWYLPQPVAGARDLKPCGTEAAYRRHKRHGDEDCDVCWPARARRKEEARRAAGTTARSPPGPARKTQPSPQL